MNLEKKVCQNCKKEFTIEPEDFKFYEKMQVPPPTFCPECRTQRRFMFRNEKSLFIKKSSFSGKEVFSMYPKDSYPKIYENKTWYSDEWNPLDYGREVDFSKPFLEQFFELLKEVPHPARSVSEETLVNSDYCNNANHLKNCYLVFNTAHDEDCMYGNDIYDGRDVVDGLSVKNSELSYDNFWVMRSNRVFFSHYIEDSHDIHFSKNLRACSNCFGCVNLRGKSYHIFNEPYSKEEYIAKLESFDVGSYKFIEKTKKKVQEFWNNFPNQNLLNRNTINSSGEYIYNSKNAKNSYYIREAENVKYSQFLITPPVSEAYDQTLSGEGSSFIYESLVCGLGVNDLKFCRECWGGVNESQYTMYSGGGASSLFGCVGMRGGQSYCILNKQYSKEEYKELFPKIIKHMDDMPYKDKQGSVYNYGEFFPSEFSPFAYNETIAQEYFPLTKEEAIEQGYTWRDPEERDYKITIEADDLPDHINQVKDSILNEVIGCAHEQKCNEQCTKAFRIIDKELVFYRRMNLPLPRLCPNCRHYQRVKFRNPLKLWARKCQCAGEQSDNGVYANTAKHEHDGAHCSNEFETSYSPDRQEIIYCESCYLKEVV